MYEAPVIFIPPGSEAQTLSGCSITDVDVTMTTVSEILRLYLIEEGKLNNVSNLSTPTVKRFIGNDSFMASTKFY